jgi:hypothetical protein
MSRGGIKKKSIKKVIKTNKQTKIKKIRIKFEI